MLLKIMNITLPIFTIALVGLFYGRYTKPDLSVANKLVVDLALPCLIFISLSNKSFDPISAAQFTGNAVLIIVLSGVFAHFLARLSGLSQKAFVPCVMFGNVGPVGIPLIALAYGPDAIPFSIVLVVLSNLLHFTAGAGIMGGRIDWKLVYANPLVWSTALGLGFSHFAIELPAAIETSVSLIADALVPLMLLALGVRLAGAEFDDVSAGTKSSLLVVLIRLVAAYLVLLLSPIGEMEQGILILFACLPPAIFNFMLADKFGMQPDKVASTVIIGHLMSLLWLPMGLWLAFANASTQSAEIEMSAEPPSAWVTYTQKRNGDQNFYDEARISRAGDLRRVWTRSQFVASIMGAYSDQRLLELNCNERSERVIESTFFTDPNWMSPAMETNRVETPWQTIDPQSPVQSLFDRVCP